MRSKLSFLVVHVHGNNVTCQSGVPRGDPGSAMCPGYLSADPGYVWTVHCSMVGRDSTGQDGAMVRDGTGGTGTGRAVQCSGLCWRRHECDPCQLTGCCLSLSPSLVVTLLGVSDGEWCLFPPSLFLLPLSLTKRSVVHSVKSVELDSCPYLVKLTDRRPLFPHEM